MRILVNGLSATSLAGKYVVEGLVRHVAERAPSQCRWLVVSPGDVLSSLAGVCRTVEVLEGPSPATHWVRRSMWELRRIPELADRWEADHVVAYSGIRLPGIRVPQVCIASNPRPLVRVPFWEMDQKVKYRLQRALYRRSSERASWTVYNSEHLRGLYRRNGFASGSPSIVIPHGLSGDVWAAASSRSAVRNRGRYDVASASVWSRYKGPETLIEALSILRERHDVPARLTLAGPWPDTGYERTVRRLVHRRGLTDVVRITGMLAREQLLGVYARARVFCLPSFTESFGIPALEAQAFGTPVVGSSTTAMPEVCGDGGIYCDPGRPNVLAEHLRMVLGEPDRWHSLSTAARRNASRYQWETCVAPLVELLEACVARSPAARSRRPRAGEPGRQTAIRDPLPLAPA